MSVERETPLQAGEGFQERLKRLRIKLDLLPEGQRPHLIDLAETIARQHQQLQNRVSQTRDAD